MGLLCFFSSNNPALTSAFADENGKLKAKGSGVVINPKGYILTARHVIDPGWYAAVYRDSLSADEAAIYATLSFDHCEVGVPQSDTVPTAAEIRSLNPQLELQHPFPYLAEQLFVPSRGAMSAGEYKNLDFAILKISKPREDCAVWNLCALPAQFPYAPVWYGGVPPASSELLNFGYPAELINASGGAFTNFLLKGAVGNLEKVEKGDSYFADTSFALDWKADDVLPGRSGSPIFWKGNVVGVVYAGLVKDITQNLSVSVVAVQRILKESNLGGILSTE